LAAAEGDRWAPWWILLLAHTGLRPEEAAALEWNAIDWESRALVVRQALTRDAEGRSTIATTTKTKRIRVVPMAERVSWRCAITSGAPGQIAGLGEPEDLREPGVLVEVSAAGATAIGT
jgi:Phage integrase family